MKLSVSINNNPPDYNINFYSSNLFLEYMKELLSELDYDEQIHIDIKRV